MVDTPNLGVTHVEPAQDAKEVPMNASMDRFDTSNNDPIDIATGAGGSIIVDPTDFLDNFLFRLTGNGGSGPFTIIFPDGNRSFSVENAVSPVQVATLDTDTGSVVKPTLAGGISGLIVEHGVELVKISDTTAAVGMSDLIDDPTPTLGGDLDADDHTISGFNIAANAQVGTTYTTVLGDSGKVITLDNASAITITVLDVSPPGWHCQIIQKGVGQVTVAAGGTGAILNRSNHVKLNGQHAAATLYVESNGATSPQVYLMGDTTNVTL